MLCVSTFVNYSYTVFRYNQAKEVVRKVNVKRALFEGLVFDTLTVVFTFDVSVRLGF